MRVLERLNSFAADGDVWAKLEKFSFEYSMEYRSQMVFRFLDGFTRLALHWYAEERGVNLVDTAFRPGRPARVSERREKQSRGTSWGAQCASLAHKERAG